MTQLELILIPHKVENALINQRAVDGYINATAMCRAVGKKLGHYLENKTTQDFLAELSPDIGIPISGVVIIIKGGIIDVQGTWVHPDVAIHLGLLFLLYQSANPEIHGALQHALFLIAVGKHPSEYSGVFLPMND